MLFMSAVCVWVVQSTGYCDHMFPFKFGFAEFTGSQRSDSNSTVCGIGETHYKQIWSVLEAPGGLNKVLFFLT